MMYLVIYLIGVFIIPWFAAMASFGSPSIKKLLVNDKWFGILMIGTLWPITIIAMWCMFIRDVIE